MAASKKNPGEIRQKELLSFSTDISHYIERVWAKMKVHILKMDSQLMSGFLIFIQKDPSLFSAGCRAGNTVVKVIPYSFCQTVSQSVSRTWNKQETSSKSY